MRSFAPVLFASALALFLTTAPLAAHAQQYDIVVPSSLTNTEGSGNNSYPFNIYPLDVPSLRFQQVFNAAEFGTRRLLITELQFRPDAEQGQNFLSFIDDIQINLSTTSRSADNLSATFSANAGADDTVVYPRTNLTLSSNFSGNTVGPKAFDITIRLNTPFVYQPANGNLLLDVRNYASTSDTTIFDAVRASGDSVSRVYALDVNAATGTRDTLGLITRFRAIQISTLVGRIDLESASNLGVPITFDFRRTDNGSHFTRTVLPDPSGNFRIDNLPSTEYEIGIKGSKWLRTTVIADLTAGDVSGFNYTLLGGDGNDDNAVDINDLILLISHYNQLKNTPPNNPNYSYAADFNNDDKDDVEDLLILVDNYNKLGDP